MHPRWRQRCLQELYSRDIIILSSDLNAKVSEHNTGNENVIGKNALGVINNNEIRLIDLRQTLKLVIKDSTFLNNQIHKFT